MMLDYPALKALAAVAETGSFEKAARRLGVTPSAVSQRVKQLEDRLGTVLIVRANPCHATDQGAWLCRHVEQVERLEERLARQLPALTPADNAPVTVQVATNADSLGTWFVAAAARYARDSGHLLGIAVDDQDHTAEWLRRGKVVAAVTALEQPVQGCRRLALGRLRYRATASPDFVMRYFPGGVSAAALLKAPAITFDRKDDLQAAWIRRITGGDLVTPTHWLPSTEGFVEAALLGMGWGMNPDILARDHLAQGRLVELVPDVVIDTVLFWQINRLAAQQLSALTRAVVETARQVLLPI